jgi:hypothetical protein
VGKQSAGILTGCAQPAKAGRFWILDFGFWIKKDLDRQRLGEVPRAPRANPKSKI